MIKFFLFPKLSYFFNCNFLCFNISLNFLLKKFNILRDSNSIIKYNKKWIFFKFINYKFKNFKFINFFLFSINFLYIKIYKAHGINMRVAFLKKKLKTNLLFLRLGYSHGFIVKLPKNCLFRIFKRRYFFISGVDLHYLNNLTFHLRFFRKFFQYKLIGIKLLRDNFKIKIGKKKSF